MTRNQSLKQFFKFDRTKIQSLLVQGLAGTLCISVVVVMAVYGLSVYVENKVLNVSNETRVLKQDNQDLQIKLDRVRSYQKVADASTKIQGLKVATDVINVAQGHSAKVSVSKPPELLPPKEVYGY
jgi:hypothetical protein